MKCREVVEILETLAPERMACDWDNPGLLAGRMDKEVKKILLTIDADDSAVEAAVSMGADMIVSHHPLIFRPVKRVTDQDFIGRRLLSMIQADMSYFAMHTNLDAAPGCVSDLAAGRLGLETRAPLALLGEEEGTPYGIGKTGVLKEPVTGKEFAGQIKKEFGLPFVTVYGNQLWEKEPVRKAAVCPGAGGSTIRAALAVGAQALVTGDIGHHDGIDAAAQGMMIIDAGHYGLAYIFMDHVEKYLRERLGDHIDVVKMPISFPAEVL